MRLTNSHWDRLTVPHTVETLLRDATIQWMANAPLTQYQGPRLDKDRLAFDLFLTINPTTLLPDNHDDDNPEEPIHDCLEIQDIIQAT